MRIKTLFVVCLTVAALVFTPISFGQSPQPETKPVTVAAFKNGLGFVVRQGRIKIENGWGTLSKIPQARFGSLWIAPSEPGMSFEEVVASQKTVSEPSTRNVSGLPELFAANAGKTVTVTVKDKEYTGEILGFKAEDKRPAPEPDEVEADPSNPYPTVSVLPTTSSAGLPTLGDTVLLKVGGKTMMFRSGDITTVSFPESPVTYVPNPWERTVKQLKFKVKNPKDSLDVTMGYLRKGISWMPEYSVTLVNDKTARLTMQALLVNDAEDLADTDVYFVVGFPNFAFSPVPSPMTLQQKLADFLKNLEQGESYANPYAYYSSYGRRGGAPLANVMTQSYSPYQGSSASPDFESISSELSGTAEEDLFLYSRPKVTLKRGERGLYPVFSGEVPYEHVYQWDVPETSKVNYSGYQSNDGSQPKEADRIWHSVRLTNTTQFPWTTAPALVVSADSRPIAQDVLGYTSKTAVSTLKMTLATDLRADRKEIEISRLSDSVKKFGNSYDLVTVEGTLKIKNFKAKPVKLCITKTVTGEATILSDGGKAEKAGEIIGAINPASRLTWEIPLKAGEEKIVTYTYKVLVRS